MRWKFLNKKECKYLKESDFITVLTARNEEINSILAAKNSEITNALVLIHKRLDEISLFCLELQTTVDYAFIELGYDQDKLIELRNVSKKIVEERLDIKKLSVSVDKIYSNLQTEKSIKKATI